MRGSILHSLKKGGLHVALIAMMVHALLPAGWMPATGAASPLVICTAAGPIESGDTQPPKHDPAKMLEHGLCPFAAFGIATPPDTQIFLPIPFVQSAANISFAASETNLSSPRFSLNVPRAPPSLV